MLQLAGLPSSAIDTDEKAKRFDLLMLRGQLAQLEHDATKADRVREAVQSIAATLLSKLNIPVVQEQAELIEAVAGDEWWVDVTVAMLEHARVRLRSLARLIEPSKHDPMYTSFQDEGVVGKIIDLPGTTPGTDFERFKAKTSAYLREHADNVALQRLRRNKQLTPADLDALESMLIESGSSDDDLAWIKDRTGGLALFIRSLVGLDRGAAIEAFGEFLDETAFSVEQVRFVNMIIDELSANGIVEPERLWEDPYSDGPTSGPDLTFPEQGQVAGIVDILEHIKQTVTPTTDETSDPGAHSAS
ncbi:type I restriction-modification enzyme R subunit C-terminal domain-containing protein [Tsukamurella strandjordii]|uniref:type I restriction-modification enzyme R subunit C-terminal domain-containing protein n=1 Tax=Tsukamurella TaxID=2060 RepID=UPI001C7E0586|nr:type I restriction-modification enzyme R subunit C-terminal domain-containing protein [Tsukamurella sp. TY48]GIZ95565.1 hypothetical protein TTY48_01770 [Tsukamurella sp. TY48]